MGDKEYYTFPGGSVEKGETVKGALTRELLEETSSKVSIDKLIYHHEYENSEQFYYLCSYKSGDAELAEESIEKERSEKGMDVYKPIWIDTNIIDEIVLYPLEIRDWLIQDLKNNFKNTPKKATLKSSELRQE